MSDPDKPPDRPMFARGRSGRWRGRRRSHSLSGMARNATHLVWLAGALWAVALPATAHPHIFIDAGIDPIFDSGGRLTAIRVTWTYDDYYSLLVLQDRGLDPDFDGELTAAEQAELDGFDMNWLPGFAGDTHGLYNGAPVGLSGPQDFSASLKDGRITTVHVRTLDQPIEVGAEPVIFQAYDPEYYTAYTLSLPPVIEGREGCTAEVFVPAPTAQSQILLDALAEVGADETLADAGIPAVGAQFAEEVRVTCAPRS